MTILPVAERFRLKSHLALIDRLLLNLQANQRTLCAFLTLFGISFSSDVASIVNFFFCFGDRVIARTDQWISPESKQFQ